MPWEDAFAALRGVGCDDNLMVDTPARAGRALPYRAAGLHAAETSLRWPTRYP